MCGLTGRIPVPGRATLPPVSKTTARGLLDRLPPGLALLRHYERGWLRDDVLAGVTVAAYLVPQVMAYAEIAGLQPVVGLWAITGSLLLYAVVGSSRQLSVGPESTAAQMTASAVAPLAAGDPGRSAVLATALALLVGAVCLLAWVARLGFLADLFSKPVLVGYMAGVAVIMIVGQLGTVSGVDVEGEGVAGEVASFIARLSQVDLPTLSLGPAVLIFLLVGGRLFPKAPVMLVAVLLATARSQCWACRTTGFRWWATSPVGCPDRSCQQ